MTLFTRASALALAISCLAIPAMAEAAKPVAKHSTVYKKKKVVHRTTTTRQTTTRRTAVRRAPAVLPANPVSTAQAPAPNGTTGTAADLVGHAGDPAGSQRGSLLAGSSPAVNAASVPAKPAPAPRPRPF